MGQRHAPATALAVYVAKGTLVIDLVDRRGKQLEWLSIAKEKLEPVQKQKASEITERVVSKCSSSTRVRNEV